MIVTCVFLYLRGCISFKVVVKVVVLFVVLYMFVFILLHVLLCSQSGDTFSAQLNGSRRRKTCLRDFRPGQTQTGLYIHRRWLEA